MRGRTQRNERRNTYSSTKEKKINKERKKKYITFLHSCLHKFQFSSSSSSSLCLLASLLVCFVRTFLAFHIPIIIIVILLYDKYYYGFCVLYFHSKICKKKLLLTLFVICHKRPCLDPHGRRRHRCCSS